MTDKPHGFTDAEIRLECLKIASNFNDTTDDGYFAFAQRLYGFVTDKNANPKNDDPIKIACEASGNRVVDAGIS